MESVFLQAFIKGYARNIGCLAILLLHDKPTVAACNTHHCGLIHCILPHQVDIITVIIGIMPPIVMVVGSSKAKSEYR